MTGNQLARWLLVILSLSAALWPSAGLSAPVAQVFLTYVDTGHLPDAQAYVSVLGGDGSPVDGLGKDQFTINEDGVGQKIVEVAPATEGMTIVLAIDTSGSMGESQGGQPRGIDEAKKAAEAFVNYVKQYDARFPNAPPDQIEVIGFNEKPSVLSGLSADHNAAINAIRSLRAEQKWTALYDAAYQAVKDAAGAQKGRRAVVLLTDGNDAGPNNKPVSVVSLDDPINLAKQNTVPIYTVGLGQDIDAQVLGRMATLSGGTFTSTSDPTQLTPLFQHIAKQLKDEYLVTYQTAGSANDHSIQVRVANGGAEAADERTIRYPIVPPTIKIMQPGDGQTVQGDVLTQIGYSALNQRHLDRVEFTVGNLPIGSATDAQSYAVRWNTSNVPPGNYDLVATATDSGGQTGTDRIKITVLAPAPTATPVPPSPTDVVIAAPTRVLVPTATPTAPPPANNGLRLALVAILGVATVGLILAAVRHRRQREIVPLATDGPATVTLSSLTDSTKTVAAWEGYGQAPPTMAISRAPDLATLSVVQGASSVGRTFTIGEHALIGREATCDVCLPDPTNTVSREHAEIRLEDDQFIIYDLDSTNGTRVDGRLARRTTGLALSDESEITLGNRYVLQFRRLEVPVVDGSRPLDEV